MTIYPARPPAFTCAICGTQRDYSAQHYWPNADARQYDIPPICRQCEDTWGKGASIGGLGDLNRDRRIARQIFALASRLEVEAYRSKHRMRPHYA
jgi:hypothetical protein